MSPEAFNLMRFIWMVFCTLGSALAFVATLWLNSRYATKGQLQGLGQRIDEELTDHHSRLVIVEQALIHAPQKADIDRLSNQIAQLSKDLSELTGEQHGQSKLLEALHDHLLNR